PEKPGRFNCSGKGLCAGRFRSNGEASALDAASGAGASDSMAAASPLKGQLHRINPMARMLDGFDMPRPLCRMPLSHYVCSLADHTSE
ncbi:hypothetical protein, partial [Sphingobium sp.]|uniref:hypothetical protein n=1 Tax=Sphingobium sp. TaxID=1912891 RepID=UPI002D7E8412